MLKELARAQPEFLMKYGLERLLQYDGSRKAVLQIYRAYI